MKIVKFRPDNFTSPARTPWGGDQILTSIKKGLDIQFSKENPIVGESWEFSVAKPLLSRCCNAGKTPFVELLETDPESWLSEPHRVRWGNRSPLLVKTIDAAQDLSLQVHPDCHDHGLSKDESGKLEAWHILHAAPGAGIYLGLKPNVDARQLLNTIRSHGNVAELFRFLPVEAGETYIIPPNTPHAIGANITLIEPQYVAPGKDGTTLRIWDWDRTYDDFGRPSPNGNPRCIVPERACRYIRFQNAHVHRETHQRPTIIEKTDGIEYSSIVDFRELKCERILGNGDYQLRLPGELLSIFVIKGSVRIANRTLTMNFTKGESGAIGASFEAIQLHLDEAIVFLCYCRPLAGTDR